MTCPFAHDDGAYVLGALSPVERLEFQRHLAGCEECTRAVGELAGLPGLLGRVDPGVVEETVADEHPPATLLPSLSREVRRTRRRRALLAAGVAAAAVVAAAVPVVLWQAGGDGTAAPTVPGASSTPDPAPSDPAPSGPAPSDPAPSEPAPSDPAPSEPVARPMRPVGDVPVRATVSLEQVTWGTRLAVTCTYQPGAVEYELPPAVDYTLFVRTRDGRAERVGSWRSVSGRAMRLSAATAASLADLASVEVRTADGRVVLTLAT